MKTRPPQTQKKVLDEFGRFEFDDTECQNPKILVTTLFKMDTRVSESAETQEGRQV